MMLLLVALAMAYLTLIALSLTSLNAGYTPDTPLRMSIFVAAFLVAAWLLGVVPV